MEDKTALNPGKFVLFADARTGGTHFIDMLNSHPNIYCVGEPFAHLGLKTHEDQIEWILHDHLIKKIRNKTIVIRGFRTKVEQIADQNRFNAFLLKEKYRCLALIRKNIVKKAISRIRAQRLFQLTNDYNVRDRNKKLGPIKIPFHQLSEEIEQCELKDQSDESYFATLPLKIHFLYYEDMLLDEKEFFGHSLQLLKAEPKPLVTRTYKNTSDNLKESITNFDQIELKLRGTKYHNLLQEVI